ncbi:MAG: hypothetical protein OT477_19825 [Chloroflexi bacterium]|nr:hypothetical protein [Chloroflexota bacterium]
MSSSIPLPPPPARTAVSIMAPLLLAAILSTVINNILGQPLTSSGGMALFWGIVGLTSWFMGQSWYGLAGMGLRGKRPLFASAGFAVLGWIALLLLRIWFIDSQEQFPTTLATDFFFLLLFESFSVQLWLFGLVFRSVADWRGPLTAAVGTGLLFGLAGAFFFRESAYMIYAPQLTALLYFVAWGLFYGLIRLRTGSLLGMVLVQALQALTAWYILIPQLPPTDARAYGAFYVGMGMVYMILMWRLWPTEESDYRV